MTTKQQLIQQIANLQKLTASGGAPAAPVDTRPRWRDGSLRNELDQLEESVDMERAAVDVTYYANNKTAIRRLQALRAEREREQHEAEAREVAMARHDRKAQRREADAEVRQKADDAREQARQDAIDRAWDSTS